MQEIKCPKCGEVFQVDESGYAAIVRQVRDKEFEKELSERKAQYLSEKERPHCLTSAAFPKESVFPDNQRICSLTLAFLPLKDLR